MLIPILVLTPILPLAILLPLVVLVLIRGGRRTKSHLHDLICRQLVGQLGNHQNPHYHRPLAPLNEVPYK
jgi:hypothetical protein